ncbi:hypothetical protein E2562_039420 [Oryza meyeriana var. granulata]|uniref:Uncharacterized protein n=1 Tax=Oryza meyeriana var. granulata TaxID=110450 RepID=A0A6G1CXR8_9ORYZ|nr:hypothetical protein E2562_039420 [Oryza meyeriana var. granulata]
MPIRTLHPPVPPVGSSLSARRSRSHDCAVVPLLGLAAHPSDHGVKQGVALSRHRRQTAIPQSDPTSPSPMPYHSQLTRSRQPSPRAHPGDATTVSPSMPATFLCPSW